MKTLQLCLLALLLTSTSVLANTQWLTATEARNQLDNGKLTVPQLADYYLERIAAHNQAGHELRAVLDVNPQVMQQAEELDRELRAGELRSNLHGLPVLIKGNIAMTEVPTTAGALVLEGFHTDRDAGLVTQLREAGLLILGSANLSEWANFRGEGSASGWSALGGQTRNPHVLNKSPCGSSSGSAVAVAADLALLAVGTETDGSILCPAAVNGIYALKPTTGSVSGDGIIPIAASQDTAGPMARSIDDLILLQEQLLRPESHTVLGEQPLSELVATSVLPERVILVRNWDENYPEVTPGLESTHAALQQLGIDVVEINHWDLPGYVYNDELNVLIYEYKRDLNQWLTDFNAPAEAATVADIVAFNEATGEAALAFYGQEYLERAADTDLTADADSYHQALFRSQQGARRFLNQLLHEHGAQAILKPSYGPAWPTDHTGNEGFSFGTSTATAVSGYPAVTLPMAMASGLPLNLSISGTAWSEPALLHLARELDALLNAYQQPEFLEQVPAGGS